MALALVGCGGSPPAPAPGAPASTSAPTASTPATAGPDWAPGLTHPQARELLELVLEDFARRGVPVRVDGGALIVQQDGDDQIYGLTNLSQNCGQADRTEWPTLIARHFDALLDQAATRDAWVATLDDWTVARAALRLRLYPPQLFQGWDAMVWREDLPGLRSTLVLDHPNWTVSVHRDQATGWQQSDAVLFATALGNQRAEPPPAPEALDLGDGVVLQAFEGASFFVASNVLCLDALPGVGGAHGTLYAIPVRTLLVALPVDGATVLQAVNKLAQIVPALERQGPGSVSPDLYWWDGTHHHRIAVTEGPEGVAVTPPAAFVELLNRLAAAPDDRGK